MKRKRILWLKSAIPWPLDQGTNFIALNLMKLLRERYDIRYLALSGAPGDDGKLDALRELVDVRALPRPNLATGFHRLLHAALFRARSAVRYLPPEVWYETPAVLRRAVREELDGERYDLVFMHYWFLSELGPALDGRNTAVLLHDNEMDRLELEAETMPEGRRRRATLKRAAWAARSHLRMMERIRHVFFYTEEDRDSFFRRAGRSYDNARVFPYYYRLRGEVAAEEDPDLVVFSGKMRYHPNVVAARRLVTGIWPRVVARRPGARLRLVGRDPLPEVSRLSDPPGVTVTGFVPDIRAEVAAAAVYAAPLTVGGGLKIKLMEAAELSRPLVATPFALQGFGFEPGRDYLAADTDEEFADRILTLLEDADRRRELGAAARRGLLGRFSGPHVEERLLALFEEITSS